MRVETIEDVLKWTALFHQNLKNRLNKASEKNDQERARMFLDYLGDHESTLECQIREFIKRSDEKALNTLVYDYLDNQSILEHGHSDSPFKEQSLEYITGETVDLHEQVLELYSHLYDRVDTDSAEELLTEVRDLEENEIKRMVQTGNRASDL